MTKRYETWKKLKNLKILTTRITILNRKSGRLPNQIRRPRITTDFCPSAYGSVLFEMGNTRIICAASVSDRVPDHAAQAGIGWITAEYSLMPYSTHPRTNRPLQQRDGRAVEIQRLIGRSLRASADLALLRGYSITVDCDVIQADGGTRTAAISGGFIALQRALNRLHAEKAFQKNPIVSNVAALSIGRVMGDLLIDLDYEEDRIADVDLNVVMNSSGKFIEVQGAAEHAPFDGSQLNMMLLYAASGIREIISIQTLHTA